MTISEALKVGKFYRCGHCREYGHTRKKCTRLDEQFNFPPLKRARKKKNDDSGECMLKLIILKDIEKKVSNNYTMPL